MPKPELNKTYICSHSYTHPNFGRILTKGTKYTCTDIDTDKDIIAMSGKHDEVNCGLKFFEEHFA